MIPLNNLLNADFLDNVAVIVKENVLILERCMPKYLRVKYDISSLLLDSLPEGNRVHAHAKRVDQAGVARC